MSDSTYLFFELFINFFQGAVFTLFCNLFLQRRFRISINVSICTIVTVLMFSVITIINYRFPTIANIEIIAYVMIMLPFSIITHKDKLYLKIIVPIVIFALYMCVSLCYSSFISLVVKNNMEQIMMYSSSYRFIYVIITNITYVFLLYIIYRANKNKINIKKPSDIITFVLIPIFTITIALLVTAIITDTSTTEENRVYLAIIVMIVFVIDFSMFSIMKKISKTAELETLNVLMTREQETYKNEVANQNAYIEEISLVKHEMKRKISLISELLERSQIEEAKKFCKNTELELKELPGLIKTDNIYFNYILNTAYQKAQNKGIEVHLTIKSSFSDIDGSDLISIVGNLIDNALEAMESISGPKHLFITTLQKEHYYILSIKNNISESVLKANPDFKTTKADKKSHGHGLKIVNKLLAKYNGNISFSEREHLFDASLMMERPSINTKIQNTQ